MRIQLFQGNQNSFSSVQRKRASIYLFDMYRFIFYYVLSNNPFTTKNSPAYVRKVKQQNHRKVYFLHPYLLVFFLRGTFKCPKKLQEFCYHCFQIDKFDFLTFMCLEQNFLVSMVHYFVWMIA